MKHANPSWNASTFHPSARSEGHPRAGPPADLPGEFCAISCYFNPCGYAALKRNYRVFARHLRRQGVPLFTIELAFEEQPYFLEPGPQVVQLRGADVLWQKERMLNLLIARLPPRFDKIAWIDADVCFANPEWVRETVALLISQFLHFRISRRSLPR